MIGTIGGMVSLEVVTAGLVQVVDSLLYYTLPWEGEEKEGKKD